MRVVGVAVGVGVQGAHSAMDAMVICVSFVAIEEEGVVEVVVVLTVGVVMGGQSSQPSLASERVMKAMLILLFSEAHIIKLSPLQGSQAKAEGWDDGSEISVHVQLIINMTIGDRVRKLDIFKKVPKDFSEGTNRGGLLSILTVLSIAYFLWVEVTDYINPEYGASIVTGKLVTRREMKIHLDITLPRFPCEIISLDIQDAMMSHSPNLGSVNKLRIDRNGQYIDEGRPFELLHEPNQERQFQMTKTAFENGYGCQLRGDFTVKEVPGNFHISSHAYQNLYARLRIENVIRTLDMSHRINYLFFGDMENITTIEKAHPEAVLSKLSNHEKLYDMTGTPHSYISHYHVDIVPTVYTNHLFGETRAYQYTYNHNTFEVNHMPSLYFNYNIDGLVVEVKPQNDGLSAFLIKLCAIVGGTYAVASFLDNALDSMFDDRRKQYELIK